MPKFKDIHPRLSLLTHRHAHNVNEFSRQTGFSSGALSRILRHNKVFGIDKLFGIKQFIPSLNLNWLMYGQQPMYLDDGLATKTLDDWRQLEQRVLEAEAKVQGYKEIIQESMKNH